MERWARIRAASANAEAGNMFVPRRRTIEVAANMQSKKMAERQKLSRALRCFVARKMMRMVIDTKKTTKCIICEFFSDVFKKYIHESNLAV